MKTWLIGGVSLLALGLAQPAAAGDLRPGTAPAAWSWTGAYGGLNAGFASQSQNVSDPYGPSIFGDGVRTPGFLLGGVIGYDWQVPGASWVLGVAADADWLDARGTETCFAFAGEATSSTCGAQPDFSGTLTGRLGYAAGQDGHTLLYVKGGAAVLHNRLNATTNNNPTAISSSNATSRDATTWGWTAGAGIEQAIAPAWSVKFEYDYLGIGDAGLASPESYLTAPDGSLFLVPSAGAKVDQSLNLFKVGLNYRFGADPRARWDAAPAAPAATIMPSGWEFEGGVRYWYSSGRFQKDLPLDSGSSSSLVSRLTYDGLTAHSGELYGRVDSPWNLFLKGYAGLGKIVDGHLNDEDWGLGYSNTRSDLRNTNLDYATIDLGYNVLQGSGFQAGAFVGYNHVHEQYAATNCEQIALQASGICAPAISNTAVITETDDWDSMRVGLSTAVAVTPRLTLSGDVAYLPYVHFDGRDNHWLRDLVIDESGEGRGAQFQAMASYAVTPHFNLGVGGRYWSMWTTRGSDVFGGTPIARNDTYRYERYGLIAQAGYKF
ncbi:outer membrane beta-barrel protein [Jiella sp. M17.18]|uniref:outer membrane beta-barrel protein n=1 Tax=Jiella sp. M17.18 TaxID=3234247 RepID=UPI0034DF65D5